MYVLAFILMFRFLDDLLTTNILKQSLIVAQLRQTIHAQQQLIDQLAQEIQAIENDSSSNDNDSQRGLDDNGLNAESTTSELGGFEYTTDLDFNHLNWALCNAAPDSVRFSPGSAANSDLPTTLPTASVLPISVSPASGVTDALPIAAWATMYSPVGAPTAISPSNGPTANVALLGAATALSGVSTAAHGLTGAAPAVQQSVLDIHRRLHHEDALIFTSQDLTEQSWSDVYALQALRR